MTMYRIALMYEPHHPRMSGKAGGAVRVRRGVWRVIHTSGDPERRPQDNVQCYFGLLFMNSTRYRAPGTLVNPRRVLAEYQEARRMCGVIMRLGRVDLLTRAQETVATN
jgi:hypothetical protein